MSRRPRQIVPRQSEASPNIQDLLTQAQQARAQRVQMVQSMQQQIEQIQQQINAESLEVLRLDGKIQAYTELIDGGSSPAEQESPDNSYQQHEPIPAE